MSVVFPGVLEQEVSSSHPRMMSLRMDAHRSIPRILETCLVDFFRVNEGWIHNSQNLHLAVQICFSAVDGPETPPAAENNHQNQKCDPKSEAFHANYCEGNLLLHSVKNC